MIPLRDTIPSRKPPVVTWAIIALNILIFMFELSLTPRELENFFYLFGIVPARYTHPAWARWVGFPADSYYPFFTSIFLHGGWAHIIGNMWTLWIFGDNVEERMGGMRYLIFYILSGVTSGIVHWAMNPHSTVPTVGASGAIAGVLGAYFILFPRSRVIAMFPILFWPVFFELPAFTYLFFWFLSQLLGGTISGLAPHQVGGIAWWAHIGGFAFGVLTHWLFLLPRSKRRRRFEEDEYGIEGAWTYWDF